MPPKPQRTARQAIENGIGRRLLELGFERKSARRYLREDERFKEWASFEIDGHQRFGDSIGLFDKELAALFEPLGWNHEDSAGHREPLPAHVGARTLRLWAEAEETWRASMRWYDPRDWFRRPPQPSITQSPFVAQDIRIWESSADPEGAAAASLAKWIELVEPWRERVRTDKTALVQNYLTWPNGGGAFKQIVCHAYLGEKAAAERICREILDEEGLAPPENEAPFYRKNLKASGHADSEYIQGRIETSFEAADLARRLGGSLGLRL